MTVYEVVLWLNRVFYFRILLDYSIIRLKSSEDILSNLNKLDYLIRASVFQAFKNTELNRSDCCGTSHGDSENFILVGKEG